MTSPTPTVNVMSVGSCAVIVTLFALSPSKMVATSSEWDEEPEGQLSRWSFQLLTKAPIR